MQEFESKYWPTRYTRATGFPSAQYVTGVTSHLQIRVVYIQVYLIRFGRRVHVLSEGKPPNRSAMRAERGLLMGQVRVSKP